MKLVFSFVAVGVLGWSLLVVGGVSTACAGEASTETTAAVPQSESGPARTRSGLQALYDFRSSNGPIVKDRSGVGQPVDLRITKPKAVRRSAGSLEVLGNTLVRSDEPPTRIIESIRRSGEITVEAWIRPSKTGQSGPARIVTLSRNGHERNFTLGQDGNRFDVRFRTLKTSANGLPSVSSPRDSLTAELTHVVYTRDRCGRARVYLNGKQNEEQTVAGGTLNWNGQFRLALANELNNSRPWLGTYYLVAIYSRDLLPGEVQQNFQAGAAAQSPPQLAQGNPQAKHFETQIAPLLANHCLECHDSSSKEGGLDLSRKTAALAGGDGGQAILPGNSGESPLWESVEADEMPADRPPLSPQEKTALRRWIDAGAIWTLETVDPAVYVHEARAEEIWLQRLTLAEYVETVRSALGVDVEEEAREMLPPDLRADGFSNTAYNLTVDLGHVDAYAKLAESVVGRMDVEAFAAKFSKSQKLTDNHMRGLITKMGKWLLRGPLDEHEITTYRGISTTVASAGGDFEEAVSYIVEAMLQSPRFLYRIESQRGDGSPWPVGQYELASRLSYILWGGPPDRELLRAADAGELHERSKVEVQVRRMLQDPRAVERSAQFANDWLDLARLENLRPNPHKFPNWDEKLATDMRDETLAFFKDVAWKQNRPPANLLNAQFTYATPRLADHYGLQAAGSGMAQYDLSSATSRGGLLTQGSVLTVGGDEASMVARGLFVLHDLLRGSMKSPPPCVDTTPVPTQAGLTQRGIAEARIANSSCGGCHVKFEPLAFGLEKFDGIGAYHEQDEHGNELREDGEILFPGEAKTVSYSSAAELMDLLAGSQRVRESITWKVTQFALGRPLVAADVPILDRIHHAAQQGGGTYANLLTAIVMSDLVQMARTEKSP